MTSYKTLYRQIFNTFGFPLTSGSAVSPAVISAAEKRLGIRVPRPLRDYYAIAGNEKRFNRSHNRFLAPKHWFVDKGRVAFLDENQSVCFWGVKIAEDITDNPPIFQGTVEDRISWFREHSKCSLFIAVMLHYQAVSGGLPYLGSSELTENANRRLKSDWNYVGQLHGQRAYSRQNQVVFLTSFFDSPILMAGAKTKDDLQAIERDLGVKLDE